jgi:hypothetical protein
MRLIYLITILLISCSRESSNSQPANPQSTETKETPSSDDLNPNKTSSPLVITIDGLDKTNNKRPSWTWTVSSDKGSFNFLVNLVSESGSQVFSAETSEKMFTANENLANGTYTLTIQYRTSEGRWSEPTTKKITIDASPPSRPQMTVGQYSNLSRPQWKWSNLDSETELNYRWALGDRSALEFAKPQEVSEFTPAFDLADGEHTLFVQAGNEFGSWSEPTALTITIDRIPPNQPTVTGSSLTSDTTPSWTVDSELNLFRASFAISELNIAPVTEGKIFQTSTPLADGVHKIFIQAGDRAGNWSETFEFSTEIYSRIPTQPQVYSALSETTDRMPSWHIQNMDQEPMTFRVGLNSLDSIDGAVEVQEGRWAPQNPLNDGVHVLYVVAVSRSGVRSTASRFSIKVDTQSPTTPVISGLVRTKEKRPLWQWTSSSDATGYRYAFSNSIFETTDASFRPASDLVDGSYNISVSARDRAGNWSTASTFTTTIDNTGPSVSTLTGNSPTQSKRPLWSWTSGTSPDAVLRFEVSLNGGQPITTSELSFTPNTDLPDGNHTLSVKQYDDLGNLSAATIKSITIDNVPEGPPGVSIVSPTKSQKPAWTLISGGGAGRYRVYLGNNEQNAIEVRSNVFVHGENLTEGTHTLSVREADFAGNWSALSTGTVQIDLTAPLSPQPIGPALTNNRSLTWEWSGVAEATKYSYRVKYGQTVYTNWVETTLTKATIIGSSDGSYTFEVIAIDAVGNSSATGSASTELDRIAPGTPVVVSTTQPMKDPLWTWARGTPSGMGHFRLKINDNNLNQNAIYVEQAFYLANLPEGTHTLYVQERDAAGNWSASGSATRIVDRTPPSRPQFLARTSPNCDPSNPNYLHRYENRIRIGNTGFENVTLKFRINNQPEFLDTTPITYFDNGWKMGGETSSLPEGNTIIHAIAFDIAGNASESISQTFTKDLTAPPLPIIDLPTHVNQKRPVINLRNTGDGVDFHFFSLKEAATGISLVPDTYDFRKNSYTHNSDMRDGVYQIATIQLDAACNRSNFLYQDLTIDTLPPSKPYFDGVQPNVSSDGLPNWKFKAADTNSFLVSIDSNDVKSATRIDSNNYTPSFQLTNGEHTVYVRSVDEAGNYSDSISSVIVVDQARSKISAVTPHLGATNGGARIEITGERFTSSTRIFLGANECLNVNVMSATKIQCTTPASQTTGSVDLIGVDSNNKTGQTLAGAFKYVSSLDTWCDDGIMITTANSYTLPGISKGFYRLDNRRLQNYTNFGEIQNISSNLTTIYGGQKAAIDNQQRVITAELVYSTPDVMINRFRNTGGRDTTFNGTGSIRFSTGQSDPIEAKLHIGPANEIFMFLTSFSGGTAKLSTFRVTETGLDASFGNHTFDEITNGNFAWAFRPTSTIDGGLLLNTQYQAIKILANGHIDRSFGNQGTLKFSELNSKISSVSNILSLENGSFIASTSISDMAGNQSASLLKLNSDGSLDQSFGDQGIAKLSIFSSFYTVTLGPDGTYVGLGKTNGTNQSKLVFAAFKPDGSIDTRWGVSGYKLLGFGIFTGNSYPVEFDYDETSNLFMARGDFLDSVWKISYVVLDQNLKATACSPKSN